MTGEGKDFLEMQTAWPALGKHVLPKGSRALCCQRLAAPQGWVLRGGISCNLLGSQAKKATLCMLLGAGLAGTLVTWQVEEIGLNQPASGR